MTKIASHILPLKVPGTQRGRDVWRDDFARTMLKWGGCLPGAPGDYRLAQFPGMEVALYKTNISNAFREKLWYTSICPMYIF